MPAEVPFTELVEVNPRRGLKRGERYAFIEMAAVPEGGGRPTHHEEREFDGGGSKFALGDTLFARITPCTENGKLAFVDTLPSGTVGFGSTELIVLSARPGRADPRFVYQIAASARVRERAISRMLGTSGRQRVPTWFFTDELTVPDIPLPEQRAIAAVLDAVDDTIERAEAVIAATEELRSALLHELLTRGVPGWHSEWKHVPGLGTVPACWEVTTLGDCIERIEAGRSPLCETRPVRAGEWGVLKVSSVSWGEFRPDENKALLPRVEPDTRFEVKAGDVILSRANTPDLVGRAVLVRTTPPRLLLSDKTLRLVPNPTRISREFLLLSLGTPASRSQISGAASGSSRSMFNVSQEALRDVRIALPTLDEQRGIAGLTTALAATRKASEAELTEARMLKAAVAEGLLTGTIRTEAAAGRVQ